MNNVFINWELSMVTSYFGNLWTLSEAISYTINGVLGNDYASDRDISESLNLRKGEFVIGFLSYISLGALVRTNYDRVFSWGTDIYGSLARGKLGGTINHPTEVTDNLNLNRESILHWGNGILLTNTNRVITWGNNSYGQLGIGSTFFDIPNGNDITENFDLNENDLIVDVISRSNSRFAISSKGYLFAWGNNEFNAVQPLFDYQLTPFISKPINITSYFYLEENENISELIMLNESNNLIRTNKNRYFLLGRDQIGFGVNPEVFKFPRSTVFYHKAPVDVTNRLNLNLDESIIHSINTTGNDEGYFLVTDKGRLLQINTHDEPILDITSQFNLNSDEKIILIVSSYGSHAVLTSYGRVFTWGDNSAGQLGDGNTIRRDKPKDITENILFQSDKELITGVSIWSNRLMFVSNENIIYGTGSIQGRSYRVPHPLELDLKLALDEKIVSIDLTNRSIITNKGSVYIIDRNLNLLTFVEQPNQREVWNIEKEFGAEINFLDILEEIIGHRVEARFYSDSSMLKEINGESVIIGGEMIVYVLIESIFD